MARKTSLALVLWAGGVLWFLPLALIPLHAQTTDQREAVRQEITPILMRITQPAFAPPAEGKAWVFEATGTWRGREHRLLLAWDRNGQQAIRIRAPGLAELEAAFLKDRSWLLVPEHDVVFSGSAKSPASGSPLEYSRLWTVLKAQLGAVVAVVRTARLPSGLELEKTGDHSYKASWASGRWTAELEEEASGGPITLKLGGSFNAQVSLQRAAQVGEGDFRTFLSPSAAAKRNEDVENEDLRWMLATAVDMLGEKALWGIQPNLVPPLVPEDLKVDGHAVLVVRGTPEEMGRRYGERLKTAVVNNMHRILHGIGLAETVRSGKWFPRTLKETWEKQAKYVPERFIREMDALADAAGVPRETVRSANIFPEHFHCSGIALRGAATEGGRLFHGRILDYMTEVGLQATAVVTVMAPRDHHAWANVGYAGCIGTVTAMNELGLAMGEMGGRGEGHLDGIPMTFLMREVMERFETTDDALAWIRSVPRTCEYFYVLSDAKTKNMAGIASWARSLAKEKKVDDLLVLRPGDSHPLLPHGIADAVLMSAGERYQRLVERVKAGYGKITPEAAWNLMGEGVAMRSALHIVLFQPETLDLWVAEASLDAKPAYTQHISKLNVRLLLGGAPVSSSSAAARP